MDHEYELKYQQFQQRILKERELIAEKQRQKKEEDLKKYKALMAEMKSLS